MSAHQARHTVPATALASIPQLIADPRTAQDLITITVQGPDLSHRQMLIHTLGVVAQARKWPNVALGKSLPASHGVVRELISWT